MKHLWKIVFAMLALAFALVPQSVQAAPAPDAAKVDKIAFLSLDFKAETSRIVVMNADGSGRTFLTDEKTVAYDPALSPNGKWLAFTTLDKAQDQSSLVVMSLDGKERKTLVTNTASAFLLSPNWSPDGKRLVFTLRQDDRGSKPYAAIMVIDADGKHDRVIGDGMLPAWSSDGKKILYTQEDQSKGSDKTSLHLMDADGNNDQELIPDALAGVFSPDGKKIAYVHGTGESQTHIYVANADGSGSVQLTQDAEADMTPQWSADGKHLYFTRIDLKAKPVATKICVINADGKNEKKLSGGKDVEALNTTDGILLFLGLFSK